MSVLITMTTCAPLPYVSYSNQMIKWFLFFIYSLYTKYILGKAPENLIFLPSPPSITYKGRGRYVYGVHLQRFQLNWQACLRHLARHYKTETYCEVWTIHGRRKFSRWSLGWEELVFYKKNQLFKMVFFKCGYFYGSFRLFLGSFCPFFIHKIGGGGLTSP
jgi:hypothetical protein